MQKYFDEHNIKIFTQDIVRKTVLEIRNNKLPDPKLIPSCGSFFKNAIVESWQLNSLKSIDPNIPLYDMGNSTYKIPAGWLIENTGLKGKVFSGMKVYEKNALVLINESATRYEDVSIARDEIVNAVRDKFGIILQQEPLEIK